MDKKAKASGLIWFLVILSVVIAGFVGLVSYQYVFGGKVVSQEAIQGPSDIAAACAGLGGTYDSTTNSCLPANTGTVINIQDSGTALTTRDFSDDTPQSTKPNVNVSVFIPSANSFSCDYTSTASGTKTCTTGMSVGKQFIAWGFNTLSTNEQPVNGSGAVYYGFGVDVPQGSPTKADLPVDVPVLQASNSVEITFTNSSNTKVTIGRDGSDQEADPAGFGVTAGQSQLSPEITFALNETNTAWWLRNIGYDTIDATNITDVAFEDVRFSGNVYDGSKRILVKPVDGQINLLDSLKGGLSKITSASITPSTRTYDSRNTVNKWFDVSNSPLFIDGGTMTFKIRITTKSGSLGAENVIIHFADGGPFKSTKETKILDGIETDAESEADIYTYDMRLRFSVFAK